MKRRQFLKKSAFIVLSTLLASKLKAVEITENIIRQGNKFKEKIRAIISGLKTEGSNLVKKVMDGKKYIFDPFTHYPYDGGIKDNKTGYQLFFHAHRKNEYGHFHTFATDENGDLVHLILISMSEDGEPIGLATVNRWVTGDKYVKADVLKDLAKVWYVDPTLYKDSRVIEFVNNLFKSFPDEMNTLFEKRDKWIADYVNNRYQEPFEDREFEVLSSMQINLGNT